MNKTLRSKIKNTFSDELLKLIGSVCDTKRIDSNQKKMLMIQQLLKRFDIRFDVLGGATNRLALFINGYCFKFAIDRQGYKDNLMEFSLSRELQPFVTKTFETNGYILVAEPVKVLTLTDFSTRGSDIKKILSVLAEDYLLGDVGYIKKNFTNWGMRDNGDVVILDYAYCHRATEKLFTCEVCGHGPMAYDSSFSYLKCRNSTVCNAKYTYNDIKMKECDPYDWDMINDVLGMSMKIPKGQKHIECTVNGGSISLASDTLLPEQFGSKENYKQFLEEERVKVMIKDDYDKEMMNLAIMKIKETDPVKIEEIDMKMNHLFKENYGDIVTRKEFFDPSILDEDEKEEDMVEEPDEEPMVEEPGVITGSLMDHIRRTMNQPYDDLVNPFGGETYIADPYPVNSTTKVRRGNNR